MSSTTKETEPAKVGSVNAWIEYFVDPSNNMVFALCSRRQGQGRGGMSVATLTEAYDELRMKYSGLDNRFRPTKHRAEVFCKGRVTHDDEKNRLVGPRELAAEFVRILNEVISTRESRWVSRENVVVG